MIVAIVAESGFSIISCSAGMWWMWWHVSPLMGSSHDTPHHPPPPCSLSNHVYSPHTTLANYNAKRQNNRQEKFDTPTRHSVWEPATAVLFRGAVGSRLHGCRVSRVIHGRGGGSLNYPRIGYGKSCRGSDYRNGTPSCVYSR